MRPLKSHQGKRGGRERGKVPPEGWAEPRCEWARGQGRGEGVESAEAVGTEGGHIAVETSEGPYLRAGAWLSTDSPPMGTPFPAPSKVLCVDEKVVTGNAPGIPQSDHCVTLGKSPTFSGLGRPMG